MTKTTYAYIVFGVVQYIQISATNPGADWIVVTNPNVKQGWLYSNGQFINPTPDPVPDLPDENPSLSAEQYAEMAQKAAEQAEAAAAIAATYAKTGPKGQQGGKGDRGDRGEKGEQGPKGDKGDTGLVGPQGTSYLRGDGNPPSEVGNAGDTYEDNLTNTIWKKQLTTVGGNQTIAWVNLGFKSGEGAATSVVNDIAVRKDGSTPVTGTLTVQGLPTAPTHVIRKTDLDASKVTTAPGSSTARSYDSKFREIVRPEDYGAKGDGTTNDTAAFNTMRTNNPRATIVLAPGKTYLLHEFSLGQQAKLEGSKGSIIKPFSPRLGPAIRSNSDNQDIEGITFDGGMFDATGLVDPNRAGVSTVVSSTLNTVTVTTGHGSRFTVGMQAFFETGWAPAGITAKGVADSYRITAVNGNTLTFNRNFYGGAVPGTAILAAHSIVEYSKDSYMCDISNCVFRNFVVGIRTGSINGTNAGNSMPSGSRLKFQNFTGAAIVQTENMAGETFGALRIEGSHTVRKTTTATAGQTVFPYAYNVTPYMHRYDEPTITVTVAGTAVAAANYTVDPDTATVTLATPATAGQSVVVSNNEWSPRGLLFEGVDGSVSGMGRTDVGVILTTSIGIHVRGGTGGVEYLNMAGVTFDTCSFAGVVLEDTSSVKVSASDFLFAPYDVIIGSGCSNVTFNDFSTSLVSAGAIRNVADRPNRAELVVDAATTSIRVNRDSWASKNSSYTVRDNAFTRISWGAENKYLANGTAASPALTFAQDRTTGLYMANNATTPIRLSVSGQDRMFVGTSEVGLINATLRLATLASTTATTNGQLYYSQTGGLGSTPAVMVRVNDTWDYVATGKDLAAIDPNNGQTTIAKTNVANTFSQAQTISTSSATPLVLFRAGAANVGLSFGNGVATKYIGVSSAGVLSAADEANLSVGQPIVLPNGSYTFTQAQTFPTLTKFRNGSGSLELQLDSAVNGSAFFRLLSGGSNRWTLGVNSTAETGDNAGSDFFVSRYDDAGVYLNNPISINRATGTLNVNNALSVGGDGITTNTLTATSNITSPKLTVDPQFYANVSGGSATINFDSTDYLQFARSTNTLSAYISGTARLSIGGSNVTSTVPLFLPSTQSTANAAAVHKEYVDGQVATRLPLSGGTVVGAMGVGSTLTVTGSTSSGGFISRGATGLSMSAPINSGGNYLNTLVEANPNYNPMYMQVIHAPNQWAGIRFGVGIEGGQTRVWDLRNDGNAYGAAGWLNGSDGRVKTDRVVLSDALEKVGQLTGYTYTRTDLGDRREVGVIAQDVKAVMPEAVTVCPSNKLGCDKDGEGFHHLNYNAVTALLVEGMKELKALVQAQAAEIAGLKAQLGKA